jgi:hypothetical protein
MSLTSFAINTSPHYRTLHCQISMTASAVHELEPTEVIILERHYEIRAIEEYPDHHDTERAASRRNTGDLRAGRLSF